MMALASARGLFGSGVIFRAGCTGTFCGHSFGFDYSQCASGLREMPNMHLVLQPPPSVKTPGYFRGNLAHSLLSNR
jgi:hypothetical protein